MTVSEADLAKLTIDDARVLARNPSAGARAETAAKLALQFNAGLTDAELAIAEEILRIMVRDAEVRVREALSANLKHNPRLPHDVALSLAKDVDSVALPILSVCDVLTAEDLVAIVKSQAAVSRLDAIAGRRRVEAPVADALVEAAPERVVAKLVANPGADLTEPTLHRVVDRFGASEAVQEPLIHRDALPVTIAERLVSRVADHLRGHLLARHRISPDIATDLVLQSRERATVGLAMGVADDGIAALVRQLHAAGRLTASLVLRAVCMGNLRFFEHAVAALANLPLINVRLLVHDSGGLGLKTAWAKAGLPGAFLPAVRAALDVVAQTELDGRALDPERYSRRIIERLLTSHEDGGIEFAHDDLEYLLARIAQLPPISLVVH
jgi:uncharacterized protein (DUF2336 family)